MPYWIFAPGGEKFKEPLPVIQITANGAWSPPWRMVAEFGTELKFPAALITGNQAALPRQIALALAAAFRYATREHRELLFNKLDDPYERWEAEQPETTSEADCDKKRESLEAKYHRALAAIAASWGFADQERPTDRSRRTESQTSRRRKGSRKP